MQAARTNSHVPGIADWTGNHAPLFGQNIKRAFCLKETTTYPAGTTVRI